MRGVNSEDLFAILDFLYCGETKVHQENLDSFLAIAEELELKGLVGKSKGGEERYLEPSEFLVPNSAAQNQEASCQSLLLLYLLQTRHKILKRRQ